jgi:hypothetical protein
MSIAYFPPEIHEAASLNQGSPESARPSTPTDPKILWLALETPQESGSVSLGTLFDIRFRVIKPIPVEIEEGESGKAAIWREIDEFGVADSAAAAYSELAKSISQLYVTLFAEKENLGHDLQRTWAILNNHLRYANPDAK